MLSVLLTALVAAVTTKRTDAPTVARIEKLWSFAMVVAAVLVCI